MQTEQLGYIGFDQFGNHFKIDKYPRKELMEALGYRSASKMYCDTKSGNIREKGYVIGPHWISVFRVCTWKGD